MFGGLLVTDTQPLVRQTPKLELGTELWSKTRKEV